MTVSMLLENKSVDFLDSIAIGVTFPVSNVSELHEAEKCSLLDAGVRIS